ncbi:MAG: hypothetical protein KAX49_20840 [Halanaerobiales bacterium]|nr:hypothetical protein [Halanaerobiales bacterium]
MEVTCGFGGAGGDGASWSDGDDGDDGLLEINFGLVDITSGITYYEEVFIKNLVSISITPANATKSFIYDTAKPNNPSEIKFPYYKDEEGVYYTNETEPRMLIKVPEDIGVTEYDFTSGIGSFRIKSSEETESFGGIFDRINFKKPYIDTH